MISDGAVWLVFGCTRTPLEYALFGQCKGKRQLFDAKKCLRSARSFVAVLVKYEQFLKANRLLYLPHEVKTAVATWR
jgi:hypothetical protein